MSVLDGSKQSHDAAARLVLERLNRRVALNEAIGILQVWRGCGRHQARRDMHARHGAAGQHVEATRMIAVVNAVADGRKDPDLRWE